MKKQDILKMTGLSEEEFYKQYPTQESFTEAYKKGGWIQKAVNPAHKGYCTPMTKATCTPRRKALARTFKKHHGFHKKEAGGPTTPMVGPEMHANGGDIFDMMGMSYVNQYGDGSKVDLKLPQNQSEPSSAFTANPMLGQEGPFIVGGVNPSYNANRFAAGPYITAGINPYTGQDGIRDYGVRGNYNITPRLNLTGEFNPTGINTGISYKFGNGGMLNTYAVGGFNPYTGDSGIANYTAKDTYANGGYTPMYKGGSWLTDAGKLALNTVASPLEQISGNNFVNFKYDNKAMADAAAVSEGVLGAATDVVGTALTGPIYGMAKGQVQNITKNIGNSSEDQRGANKWANKTGQIVGSTGDLAAGIASGNAQQIVGGAGNLLGTAGQQFGSQGLASAGQIAGLGSQFIGSSKTMDANPMSTFMRKNGGYTPEYAKYFRKFAEGGMTVGNVESQELLVDPQQLGAGGVPQTLANYTNLPPHPADGSIDDRGTVPLQEGKFIITKAMANQYKKAASTGDKLHAEAIMNNIEIKRQKKEAEEMAQASTAYNKFMAKYGGAIQKMYNCGGMTHGCGGSYGYGGMTRYADGAGVQFLSPYISNPAGVPSTFAGVPYDTNYMPGMQFPASPTKFDLSTPKNIADFRALEQANAGTPTMSLGKQSYMNNPIGMADANLSQYGTASPITKNPSPSPGRPWQDTAATTAMLAPAAYNIGRGLFAKTAKVPSNLGMVSTDVTAPRLSDAQGKRLIREQMNLGKYNAGQLGGSNALPYLSAMGTSGMKASADYAENLSNRQAALDYDALVKRRSLEQANAAQAAQNWAMQQQINAQKENFLSQGMSDLGKIGDTYRQQQAWNKIYGDLYSNYAYDPKTGKWTAK